MKILHPPESEVVVADLEGLLPIVSEAIEFGIQKARDYFRSERKRLERSLAAALVRFHAKHYMDDELALRGFTDVEVSELEEDDAEAGNCRREELANNGLMILYKNYKIKILKSQNGELPAAGPSKSRQEFYTQELPLSEPMRGGNLVVRWDVDSRYRLTDIIVSRPYAGGLRRQDTRTQWEHRLPDPVLTLGSKETPDQEPSDLEGIELRTPGLDVADDRP